MGIPSATHQTASNAVAGLGNWISLHTAAAGTTGANEASGGSYARQQSTPWTPDGIGDNNGPQVQIFCAAGTYVEAGIFSTGSALTLAAPSGVGATGSGSGGTFTAATYYWKITATNFAGETTASAEASAVLSGSSSSCALSWSTVSGATGYNIYRGTTSNGENVLIASVGAVTSYTDTGTTGTTAAPPGSNTASTFVGSNAFTGGSVTVSGSGASINVNPSISV